MGGSEICESGFYGKHLQSLPTDYEEEVYDFEGLDDTEDFSTILTDRGEDKTRNSIQLAPGAMQTKEEIEAMTFANEVEAYDWYNLYALTLGFGVRRCNCKYFNPETKEDIKSRIFVCARQGLRSDKYTNMENRKREHTRNSRVLCKARIKIARTSSSEPFRVKFFQPIHSHELADPQCVRNYRSHRKVPESDVELILSLREVGIRYCQAYLLMVKQAGGYCNVPYTQKDMYNKMRSMDKVYSNHGDGQQTLLYIDSLAESHYAVFMRYNLGENNELQGVFWCDKRSYIDYMRFGDVLVFDATYKTNMYLKPFVILSGVNNHYETTVFACAILNDEKIPSYEWVLQCLMEAMHNKQPLSVITDGDLSMKSAIESTFPNARHRLCSWHICRNAQANLKLGSKFLSDFKRCMHSRKPDPYWHNEWHAMVQKWNLADNNWIQVTYMNRRMWAETYLKDHFFALQTSTSRCESINSFFKRHMSCRDRLIDVCKGFVTGLDRLRNNERKAHFKSDQSDPVLTTAFPHLEAHALVIYTHKVYKMFKVEAEKAEGYTLLETMHDEERNVDFYYVRKGEMKTTVQIVQCSQDNEHILCTCYRWESSHMICKHILLVLSSRGVQYIPKNLIADRWIKTDKAFYASEPSMMEPVRKPCDDPDLQAYRRGSMRGQVELYCNLGCTSSSAFNFWKEHISNAISKLKSIASNSDEGAQSNIKQEHNPYSNVQNPNRRKKKTQQETKQKETKQETKKDGRRRCSNCRQFGHNKATCPNPPVDSVEELLESDNYSQQIPSEFAAHSDFNWSQGTFEDKKYI